MHLIDEIKNTTLKNTFNLLINNLESLFKTKICLSKPVNIEIAPTKNCNLDCIFCIKYKTIGEKNMSLENFQNISKILFPYAKNVSFCSGGEPFLNKNMINFLKICQKYKTRVTITTNASLFNEKLCKILMTLKCINIINISLDGSKKSTVESIRKNIDFDKTIENIKLLCKIKKEKRSNTTICLRYAVLKRNIKELPEFIKLAKTWGVDQIDINYLYATPKISSNESLFFHKKILSKYLKLATQEAIKQNILINLPESIYFKNIKKCKSPWNFLFIDTDCNAKMCYRTLNNSLGKITNISEFNKIWNSKHIQNIRKTINSKKNMPIECKNCPEKIGYSSIDAHIHTN